MTRINRMITALLLALTLFINAHKPSDHEHLSESPTESPTEYMQSDILAENLRARAEAYSQRRHKAREVEPVEAVEPVIEPPKPTPIVYEMTASHYTARCDGCSGITKAGYDVRNTIYAPNGLRIIAVDISVIALGTTVRVTYPDGTTFDAIAGDVGGGIKNLAIDVLVASKAEAYRLGRQQVSVQIINE